MVCGDFVRPRVARSVRRLQLAALTVLVGACIRRPHHSSEPAGTDLGALPLDLFAAAVRTVADSASSVLAALRDTTASTRSSYRLSVDPRPLRSSIGKDASLDAVTIASLKSFDETSPEIVARRSRELKRLGIPLANAATLVRCPGTLSPVGDVSGCPKRHALIAVLGLPQSESNGQSSIDVLVISADSGGRNAIVTRYAMASRNGQWILVSRELPVIVE